MNKFYKIKETNCRMYTIYFSGLWKSCVLHTSFLGFSAFLQNYENVYTTILHRPGELYFERPDQSHLCNIFPFIQYRVTDLYGVCCLAGESCVIHTQALEFTNCGRLLPSPLSWFIWIMAAAAISGNILVIILRHRRRNESTSQNVQRVLILNLGISDLLMGIYMIIIGAADVHYGQDFFWYSEKWRTENNLCKIAGFLVLLSSETSVFIITAISIDRFLILVFPFGKTRLRGKVFHLTMIFIWSLSMILALVGIIGKNEELYGQSNVCIGLPLLRRYVNTDGSILYDISRVSHELDSEERGPGWTLSIAIFLGINFFCLLTVLFCYIAIFISVRKSRQTASRDPDRTEEIKMALKMSLIVGTDFCCWMPIVILGIITQSGDAVSIQTQVYAWIIVFILPINSAINPYIYSINSALDFRKRRSLSRKSNRSTVTFRLTRLLSSTKEREKDSDSNQNTSKITGSSPLPSPSLSSRGRVNSSPRPTRNNGNYLPVSDH